MYCLYLPHEGATVWQKNKWFNILYATYIFLQFRKSTRIENARILKYFGLLSERIESNGDWEPEDKSVVKKPMHTYVQNPYTQTFFKIYHTNPIHYGSEQLTCVTTIYSQLYKKEVRNDGSYRNNEFVVVTSTGN